MKSIAVLLSLAVLTALTALGWSFAPQKLAVQADHARVLPTPRPPATMKLSAVKAGHMNSLAMFAYRGGGAGDQRVFGMGGILIQHPLGTLLVDAGFGRNVDEHFKSIPWLMQLTSQYERETPIAVQLGAAGIALDGIILTHAHWDHVSGLEDMAGVPIWVNLPELDFIRSGDPVVRLIASFGELPYKEYEFSDGPYLGFEKSRDVFGDGSVVLVPAPGHTPGSIIVFVSTPDGQRYALIGDLVWQKEGIDLPAERPWVSRFLVDWDEQQVRGLITRMHLLQRALPELIIVPAHDRRVWDQLPQFGS